jgi:uncharacterized Zn ribbon protein
LVSGHIYYHGNTTAPLEDVTVELIDTAGTVFDSDETNVDGLYQIGNVPDGTYILNSYTSLSPGGIDLADSYLIFLYLINLYSLDPIQELAADVDGDGVVEWDDYWFIVNYWFLYGIPFPAGDWVFETVEFSVSGRPDGVDAGGTSTGDVTGNFQPVNRPLQTISTKHNDNIIVDADEEFMLNITGNCEIPISGMGLIINYQKDMVTITDVLMQQENMNFNITDGKIKISWIDMDFINYTLNENDSLITLKLKTTNKFLNCGKLNITIDEESHFIDSRGNKIDNLTLSFPSIESNTSNLEQITNYPNPFNEYTNFEYLLNEDANVTLKIYNLLGKEIVTLVNNFQTQGFYSYTFNQSDFNLKQGTYIYKINIIGKESFSQSNMMIITR